MKQILIAAIFASAVWGQAQTKKSVPKPPAPAQKQTAVSEPFAKIALHVLIAMRSSGTGDSEVAHVKSLLEDLELAQTTELETLLTKLWRTRYDIHLIDQRSMNELARIPPLWKEEVAKATKHDACFDAYIALVKANDKTELGDKVPPECALTIEQHDNVNVSTTPPK